MPSPRPAIAAALAFSRSSRAVRSSAADAARSYDKAHSARTLGRLTSKTLTGRARYDMLVWRGCASWRQIATDQRCGRSRTAGVDDERHVAATTRPSQSCLSRGDGYAECSSHLLSERCDGGRCGAAHHQQS